MEAEQPLGSIDHQSSGIQGPVDFPSEVSLPALFQHVYQTSVSIGGRMFAGVLYDQGPHHESKGTVADFLTKVNYSVFQHFQMDVVDKHAYRASLIIGGHMFSGVLYDQSPRHELKENIEEQEGDLGSKEQCLGVVRPETSANQGQPTFDNPASEDSGSKETKQELGVVIPETSGNQGEVTIDNPSSEQGEDLGSKETEQEQGEDLGDTKKSLVAVNSEASGKQGHVTIDNPSSEKQEVDLGSKVTEQSLGVVVDPESSRDHGEVAIDDPSSENIHEQEEESASKDTEKFSNVASPETSGNEGQVTADDPMQENIKDQEEDLGSKDAEQCLGVANPGNQGQVTIYNPSSENSGSSGARKHKVSYKFLEFPYPRLVTATLSFVDLFSKGYYGSIYCGILSDPNQIQDVAVKLLNNAVTGFSNDDLAKLAHYFGRASHPNIVKFVGCCNEHPEKHILVYEFIPTTLAYYLHGPEPQTLPLDWATRMTILHGVAKALDYLHNTMTPRVIHGDLDSSNILLDGDEGSFHSKLCGFGLGKLKHSGYCASVHANNVQVSTICDILGFGVVFLELLTGQKAYDETRGAMPWLPEWVQRKVPIDEMEVQDPSLKGKVEHYWFGRALRFAVYCTHPIIKLADIAEVVTEMEYLTGQKVDYRPTPDFVVKFDNAKAAARAEGVKKPNKNNQQKSKKNKNKKKKKKN